jgi:lipopolysaccharide/colanic/teichoic acid biosynthesis glycosyltransferase
MRLSLEYVRTESFWLDCKIIWETLGAIMPGTSAERNEAKVEHGRITDVRHEP